MKLSCFATAIVLALVAPVYGQSTLDKGHRLLIEYGLQIQACSVDNDLFHLGTLQDANITAPNWMWSPNLSLLGVAPGVPWGRWIDYTTQNDLPAGELPYKPNLISLCVGDEQWLDTPSTLDATINWFSSNASKFPDTILYTNQWGSETTPTALRALNSGAHPDMLSFDTYPFGPTSMNQWYTDAAKYRALGAEFGIPVGYYLQTYHSTSDGARDPSGSEIRWNQFAGWTFGFKFANAFIYNNGNGSLFTSPGGDSNPNQLYQDFRETTRESRNLGPMLVRLDSTDVRFVPGQHDSNGTSVTNDTPGGLSNWSAGAGGDPYIYNVSVKSNSTFNNGLKGDALIGFFKLLQPELYGSASDEEYFMITNGLTDPNATPEQTQQTILVDFNFKDTGINSLMRWSRLTGQVETVPMYSLGRGYYRLALTLDGGTGDLFKYNDGIGFPSSIAVPEPTSLGIAGLASLIILCRRRRTA